MSLQSLFHEKNWSAFEESWTALMAEDSDLTPVFDVLRMASERKQMSPCVPLVREHAELLGDSGRAEIAARILGDAMLGGGSPGELGKPLWERAHQAWGAETWFAAYAEIAGFTETAPDMRGAWTAFHKLLRFEPGVAIYHAKGWGIGQVLEVDRGALEVKIRFATGRSDRFPLSSAVDIFEVLGPDDLRSLVINDPEELKRRVKEEPLEVLAAILRRYQGKATHPLLKLAMSQLGIDGPAFTGWWKRTRKAAESSAWYEISGTGAKTQVRALLREADPAENLRRQLKMVPELKNVLQRVRTLLSGGELDEGLKAAALDTLEELALVDDGPLSQRLGAWMFLRDERKETPPPLLERLVEAAAEPMPESPSEPQALWALFGEFPGAREQERCTELLPEILGEDNWREEAERNLPHAAPGMVRGLVDELLAAKKEKCLADHYSFLLARQSLNPHLFIRLAELVETGRIEGDFPATVIRAQALLQLSTRLLDERAPSPAVTRARTRLNTLLTKGKPPLLRRMFEGANREELRTTLNLVERGVDDVIESCFTDIVVEMAPDIFRAQEKPFWQEDAIWTTRAGLSKRENELRELMDVKIPENSEAIGKAASLGDLSENSEWESAMEEQRNLTTRASQIEGELKIAQLIEDATLAADTASPGTSVRYREVESGDVHTVRILGPWDTDSDDVVSYLSPLAQGLLGCAPGDTTTLNLPSGDLNVELIEIKPISV